MRTQSWGRDRHAAVRGDETDSASGIWIAVYKVKKMDAYLMLYEAK